MSTHTLQPGQPAPPLEGQPVFGLPLHVGTPAQRAPAVVCFLRHLGSPPTRAALARLQAAMPAFDHAGVDLIAVSASGLPLARDFVPRHHLLFPLLCDPGGAHAARWGLSPFTPAELLVGALRDLPALPALLAAGQGRVDGPLSARPGAFAVRADGTLARCAVAAAWSWLPEPEALLGALCSP